MADWEIDGPRTIQFDETPEVLRVALVAGDVEVTAAEGPAILMVKEVVGRPLEVSLSGGRLEVIHERRSWPSSERISASIVLNVPAECRVQLEAVSASVLAAGLAADARIETVSGELTLESMGGPVRAITVSGDLASRGQAGQLRGETVSGDVTLDAYSATSVKVHSVSGEVVADLQQAGSDASAEVATVSGNVYLRLAEDPTQEVRLESVSGRLSSAFPGLQSKKSPGSRSLKGSLGVGQGRLKVTTVSGAVALLGEADA
ncbi:MAG TPA: DUF4097 family beta strand repeat-containing protein [Candidatus Dormibacteraeota bacterium]